MRKMVDLTALPAGYSFPPRSVVLDRATVETYLAAVEDEAPLYRGDGAPVPPLAVLALALRDLVELLPRHPGAVHATQRLTAHHAIPVGSTVVVRLTVQTRSERGGFAALSLATRVEAADALALDGVALLMIPLPAREQPHA
jgi:acyl dehydratase